MSNIPRILTCVYCGHQYPAGTPASGSEVQVLTDHIKSCDKHPMRGLSQEILQLNRTIDRLERQLENVQMERDALKLGLAEQKQWIVEIQEIRDQYRSDWQTVEFQLSELSRQRWPEACRSFLTGAVVTGCVILIGRILLAMVW